MTVKGTCNSREKIKDLKEKRYYDFNSYLRSCFGERVQKITVDTGLGCPNRDGRVSSGGCIYCNSRGSGNGLWEKGFSITDQIEQGRKAMMRRYKAKKFLVYFQSYTNTYTSCKHMKSMYDEALTVEGVVGMAIGTRPDCIDEEKIELIASYTPEYLVWLEYGVQSIHDATLERINRGHDFASVVNAVNLAKKYNINICAHIILGLPGENRSMMMETARRIGELGIDGVKLHLLYVVKGTLLEQMYKNGSYKCLSMNEYVELVCDFIAHLPEKVIIQRITGDPHADELAAPLWALDYHLVYNMIQDRLEERDIRQGDYF
nr:TIGR01212 family radical SAM protein [Desulfamplus magnetovallimortis]